MNKINSLGAIKECNSFPGYLLSQFAVKDKKSGEGLALLSLLDTECVQAEVKKLNSNPEDMADYLSEMQVLGPEMFDNIYKSVIDLRSKTLDVELVPLNCTVVPFTDATPKVTGTLMKGDPGQSSILWSLVALE